MNAPLPEFHVPSAGERIFNRIFGFLVGIGLGFSYNYLLQVRGRKSGKIYSRLRALSDAEKPEILKAYLDRFRAAGATLLSCACRIAAAGVCRDRPKLSSV